MKMIHVLIADVRGNEVGRVPYNPKVDAVVDRIKRQLSSILWTGNITPLHFVVADKRGRAVRMMPPIIMHGFDNMIHTGACNEDLHHRTGESIFV